MGEASPWLELTKLWQEHRGKVTRILFTSSTFPWTRVVSTSTLPSSLMVIRISFLMGQPPKRLKVISFFEPFFWASAK